MTTPETSATIHQPVSLWKLAGVYLLIGFTGFGPALAAETRKHLVKERKWLSEEDFLNGLALAQMLPGAIFASLTVYVGYKIRGIAGALTSFFAFLLPPFSLMLLLSYVYFTYGSLPSISVLFQGMAVVVAGLVANAVIDIGKSTVTDIKGIGIAAGSVGIMTFYPSIFLLLFLAATAGIVLYFQPLKRECLLSEAASSPKAAKAAAIPFNRILMLVVILALAAYGLSWQPVLQKLGLVFFRMGSVLFGGGFSMIPFIQQEVVYQYHWLTLDEFVVGIALGQVTPGPVLITATFIGYKVAGVSGAIVSTLGVFLPSLFLVILTAEIHQKFCHNLWIRSAIKGIVAAFTGMILVVAFGLAQHSLVDIPSVLLAVMTFAALRFSRLDTIWVVLGGTLLYWLIALAVL